MSTTELNEFPSDAFRALLAASPSQRDLIKRYMECGDDVQSVVRAMFAVLENEHSSNQAKQRAYTTIAAALFLDSENQLDSQEASFADRLNRLLIEKNITQEQLADRVGCTQSAISKMLKRNARPRRSTISKMAEALGVEPTELWPRLEVAAILDSVSDFFTDRELTPKQAESLDAASSRPPVKVKTRRLPSRKRN